MATPAPIHGKNAKIRLGTSDVIVSGKWEATFDGDTHDTVSFEDDGYNTQIMGVEKCTVTIDGWYDKANCPFDTPYFLTHGKQITSALKFFLKGTTGPCVELTKSYVHQPKVLAEVRGLIRLSATFYSQGAFVYPTGNPS